MPFDAVSYALAKKAASIDDTRRTSTKIIAASNSLDTRRVDYKCDGTADESEIESAIGGL